MVGGDMPMSTGNVVGITSEHQIGRLGLYYFRAELMHRLLHGLLDKHKGDVDALESTGDWWEFETYLSFWLSGLFVVVEGFNKLKLKDARVQKLFKEHLNHLKYLRHETYHFTDDRGPSGGQVIKQLNWAEELHTAIHNYLVERAKTYGKTNEMPT